MRNSAVFLQREFRVCLTRPFSVLVWHLDSDLGTAETCVGLVPSDDEITAQRERKSSFGKWG